MSQDKVEWDLPHLHTALLLPRGQNGRPMARDGQPTSEDFWSVSFYPFSEPGVPAVFAVVGENRILVCRPPTIGKDGKETSGLDVIATILDDEEVPLDKKQSKPVEHVACAWTKHHSTNDPLLCVAGSTSKIKIFDVVKGKLYKTIIGHGGPISDLKISPTYPYILASASDDCSVRIWNLHPRHAKQPCVAVLEGHGHTDFVHTVSFHQNGRYLLSAGVDRSINLWTLPDFSLEADTGRRTPLIIHYPHFSTTGIHRGIVDCVMWHGDLIFSKAESEHAIILWTIDGFDSTLPPPGPMEAPSIPIPMKNTRSSFCPPSSTVIGYTSHLTFNIPSTYNIFFTRFAIFPGSAAKNPVLSFLNGDSQIYFWDLARFIEYRDVIDTFPDSNTATTAASDTSSQASDFGTRSHPFLRPYQHRSRKSLAGRPRIRDSPALSTTGSTTSDNLDVDGKVKVDWVRSQGDWTKKYDMNESHTVLEAHQTVTIPGVNASILGRQMAWSPDGKWCVGVGSLASIVLLTRWEGRDEEN